MKPPPPRQCPEFVADPDLGLDHRQRATCRNCGRVGEPGDVRHTPPPAPALPPRRPLPPGLAAAARARDAAILGERPDGEE
ncbi:hypothetical protein [Micromonospora sp. RTGN7]|uniref:hypothetical protein n=1 Tax=Micromonospora sp. RTGN7 TaxID=3016526 RepID=UPI0029FEE733|nr:hypothetical protein [Micromonospora sp. RTGN7]